MGANSSNDTAQGTSDRESLFRLPPRLIFSLLALISVAVWWDALASSFALALRDDQYTHILLILPVSVALMFWIGNRRPHPPEST